MVDPFQVSIILTLIIKMDYKVIQDYVITPVVLGKGCFGTVYRGYMKNNKSQLLAVKAIPLNSIKNEDIIRREI